MQCDSVGISAASVTCTQPLSFRTSKLRVTAPAEETISKLSHANALQWLKSRTFNVYDMPPPLCSRREATNMLTSFSCRRLIDFPMIIACSLQQSLRMELCTPAGDDDDGDEKGDEDGSMDTRVFARVGLSEEEDDEE